MRKRIDSDLKQYNKKVKIGIFIGVILVVIAIASIVVIVLCNQSEMSDDETLEQEVTIVEEPTIDFNQKITAEDGKDAKTTYELGDKNNLSMRFPDLKCNEQCSNVKNLKLNNQNLVLGKDYEVRSGSVIIILLSEYMETLEVGQYELTFEITINGTIGAIGVRFAVQDEVPTCSEKQELKDNGCVEKASSKTNAPLTQPVPKKYSCDPTRPVDDCRIAMLGTCPSEREESGSYANAIGIITDGSNPTNSYQSFKWYIEAAWDYWKSTNGGPIGVPHPTKANNYLIANLANISDLGGGGWVNSNRGLYVDWNTLTIYLDSEWSGSRMMDAFHGTDYIQKYLSQTPSALSAEQAAYLNQKATEATNYLRWLDSAYRAKCPND